jgi:hypothetical protein
MRDGQFRVELSCAHERTPRFVMIESVDKLQALIKKLLRPLVLGRDRMMNLSAAGH